jgi:RNA polymerase sigma-70 factor (ECF subfamily)
VPDRSLAVKNIIFITQPRARGLREGGKAGRIEDRELYQLLDSCTKGDRSSQDKLYREFYGYAMGICLRYSRTREEATEIVNDGYVKIFTKLSSYTRGLSFKGWLRKVMIHSAIDYFRRNEKHYHSLDISHANYEPFADDTLSAISAGEIIDRIQELPPSYRMVFNLHVIEGYTHDEIAAMLGISTGTSKSNLSVARNKLKKMLFPTGSQASNREHHG